MLTLASDFASPYPAAMRLAIRQHTDAEIVDVAHDFPRQDVGTAAFWLREVLAYSPPAVHCAVVDPTVGSERAAIAFRVGEHALVAPDNGLVRPAARRLAAGTARAGACLPGTESGAGAVDGPEERHEVEAFAIRVEDPPSATFHGRDVFAPAAARIHEVGVDAMDDVAFLEPTTPEVDLQFPDPEVYDDGAEGEVLVVDGFGTAITNVPDHVLVDREAVTVAGERWPVGDHYAAVEPGEGLVTVGSHGNVELAVNQGRGADRFDVEQGDAVDLRWE